MEINNSASGRQRVLITGAAGFLGSHLCDRFIKEGVDVVGMDNLITGDLKNIQHLLLETLQIILISLFAPSLIKI